MGLPMATGLVAQSLDGGSTRCWYCEHVLTSCHMASLDTTVSRATGRHSGILATVTVQFHERTTAVSILDHVRRPSRRSIGARTCQDEANEHCHYGPRGLR